MNSKQLITIAIAAVMAAPAAAQVWTGNELLKRLRSTEHGERMSAFGYVRGITDAMNGQFTCPPDGSNYGQAYDIVENWLTRNPERRHQEAGFITVIALNAAWPCSNGKKGGGA